MSNQFTCRIAQQFDTNTHSWIALPHTHYTKTKRGKDECNQNGLKLEFQSKLKPVQKKHRNSKLYIQFFPFATVSLS